MKYENNCQNNSLKNIQSKTEDNDFKKLWQNGLGKRAWQNDNRYTFHLNIDACVAEMFKIPKDR